MGELTTDPAVLSKEAGNFERISAELKGVIAQVEARREHSPGSGTVRPASPRSPRWSDSARLPPVRCRS